MAILYRNELKTGLLSKVRNEFDGKVYNVSTAQLPDNSWQTVAFPAGAWGTLALHWKRPLIIYDSSSHENAVQAHEIVENMIEAPPRNWPPMSDQRRLDSQ